jgi:signal transduction histidine kinase
MKAKGIAIHSDVAPIQLQGDPERLLQAFLNILDNAIKHSSADSQIFIHGYRDGKHAIVKIQDQGTGIKPTDLPRIFEQFYTADPARKGTGSGLGLAIAQRIVSAHGGLITASSQPGQGATFIISLPL